VDVDLELRGQPRYVDVQLDSVCRDAPKEAASVSLSRCLEVRDAPATASRLRPDKELAATLADEIDRAR
jgi:hypothetical protein